MNDVSVIRVSRCGITRGTLSGKHVLTLIWMIMTGGSFKIVSNWPVLTIYVADMVKITIGITPRHEFWIEQYVPPRDPRAGFRDLSVAHSA